MYKVIRVSSSMHEMTELENLLNDGYRIVNVSETHSSNFGVIIYVLKKGGSLDTGDMS